MIASLITNFANSCNHNFLGLNSWWAYLPDSDFGTKKGETCDIKVFHLPRGGSSANDIPLVMLAVIDDLLKIAGMVSVAFVLYGSIKLIASQGEPDTAANARGTITNALIGVAICTIAVTVVSFIGRSVGK